MSVFWQKNIDYLFKFLYNQDIGLIIFNDSLFCSDLFFLKGELDEKIITPS